MQNFSLSWQDYRFGFGDLNKEFWFGNDYIHRLTNEFDMILRIDLWDFEGNRVYAEYETFKVDSEEDQYRIWVGGYKGNATDSFSTHSGYAFSTWDRDNDEAPPCCPCAPAYGGGWWFYSCFEANLNGAYHRKPMDNDYYRGIIWEMWRGDYSLRATEMKVRPRNFSLQGQEMSEDYIPEDP
ncbi:techylectin-5B-like [Artemia franciscana]|uniref:techylectin-5B-like n=1 Tax=Artemia franciscana TaxID=6661 RepID=UPI0032D9ED0E